MVYAMINVQLTEMVATGNGAPFANTGPIIGIIFLGVVTALIAKDAEKIAIELFGEFLPQEFLAAVILRRLGWRLNRLVARKLVALLLAQTKVPQL